MTRLHTLFALVALAPLASAQDDPATAAQKQLPDIQKQLAGGTALQQRLRVDSFADADGPVKVAGVFLDSPAAKTDDPVPFDAVREEVEKLVRERLKDDALKFDWSGVTKVAPKDHPHALLQLAATAAGATEPAADRIKLDGSRFAADGALVVAGLRAKDDATAKWLAAATAKHLAKHPAVKVVNSKPLVTDEVKAVDWKLAPTDVQKLFAASADAPTRRLRADRVYFAYDVDNPDPAARWGTLNLTLAGVRLGEDAVDAEAIPALLRTHWPELFAGSPKVLVDAKPLLGPGIPEPAAKLQAAVAATPSLDGVRIDPGAEFGPAGELMLAGLQPGLTAAGEKELAATYRAVLKAFIDKGDEAAKRYAALATGGVSAARLKPVPTGKLLAELREWAADTADDVRPTRLYFAADRGLKLQAKTVTKLDGAKLAKRFAELAAKYLPADPPAPEPPVPAADLSTFTAGLTAHLKQVVTADTDFKYVLIERGSFDADDRYTLRGVADSAAQNDKLATLLAALKAEPRWADYFAPAPNPPALAVIPMRDLLDRVRRVTPAYPAFDGVRITDATYDADGNLIFAANVAGKPDPAAAALLAKLLRDSPAYRRRAPADKQVKIARTGGAATTDRQAGQFSVAYGAKLLAGSDEKEAKAWIDSAILHYPNEAGVWFLSAYYNYAKGDTELVRRDLYRMIDLEGPLAFNGPAQRRRRYEDAKDLQGKARTELEALWLDYFREVKDGAKRMTMTQEK